MKKYRIDVLSRVSTKRVNGLAASRLTRIFGVTVRRVPTPVDEIESRRLPTPEMLFQANHAIPTSWFPDGTSLLFSEWADGGIWRLPTSGGGEIGGRTGLPALTGPG